MFQNIFYKIKINYYFNFILFIFFFIFSSNVNSVEGNWFYSYGNVNAHKFSNLDQININNVNELKLSWVFEGDNKLITDSVQVTPIFTGDKLIIADLVGNLMALNPENGNKIWQIQLDKPVARRGFMYSDIYSSIFVPTKNGVHAISVNDGGINKEIGKNGIFGSDLSLLSPVLDERNNQLITANLRSNIVSYDIKTGKQNWKLKINSGNLEPRIWSGFSFDAKNEIIFIVTSNPGDVTGADRNFEKDYSCSLIAINAKNGKILWSYQDVKYDLWDYDLVGAPIILNNDNDLDAVIALGKTGNTLYFNSITGEPIFADSIKNINVQKSDIKGVNNSDKQKIILKPEPFSNIDVDPKKDLKFKDHNNKIYLEHKLRHAKYGLFKPPSTDYDVVLKGIHGGAEWPGGSVHLDKKILIVPSNDLPWIIRVDYKDTRLDMINGILRKLRIKKNSIRPSWEKNKIIINNVKPSNAEKIYATLYDFNQNSIYKNKCSGCHGITRNGYYQDETQGDKFIPSLVGISLKKEKFKTLENISSFNKAHKFVIDNKFQISDEDLLIIKKYFQDHDKYAVDNGYLKLTGSWQLLLDKYGLPATNSPWGFITATDLSSGKILWKIPNGITKDRKKNNTIKGSINFGGVLTTKGNLIFSTGTTDNYLRAYDIDNGKELWSEKLKFSGSSPPMTFYYNNCQYLVINSSGGRFIGFDKEAKNFTYAYKLSSCN